MPHLVRMVPLGPNNDEAVAHEWLIDVGQPVEAKEPLVSVETDKTVIEVEFDVTGKRQPEGSWRRAMSCARAIRSPRSNPDRSSI